MAARRPLTHVALTASSIVEDLGYVAFADVADVLGRSPYRIIGGHMVTALATRWQLGTDLYRETNDTDVGVPPVVVRDEGVIEHLAQRGYRQIDGNRFARDVADLPLSVGGVDGRPQAVIDVLVPAYRSRARASHRVSPQLVTTEVPGLALALQRDPVLLHMELHRLNGTALEVELVFPDEVAALTLKALATQVRSRPTDVVDLWRLLEVANTAGTDPAAFAEGDAGDAARVVRALFDRRLGIGMAMLADEQRLSVIAADRRFTRIQALVEQVLPPA